MSKKQLKPMPLNDEGWRRSLTPEQYSVLRKKGTEAPNSGKLTESKNGTYVCAACGNPLFSAKAKFHSGTGWPSFDRALPGTINLVPDHSLGIERIEITCARCGSHLGHRFNDGPTKTGKRYCLNSICLDLDTDQQF